MNKKFLSLILLISITGFSILYQGYYFGQIDGALYVPYLKSLANPSLYPHDLFVQTWKVVYFANLWKVLALFLPIIPVQTIFLVCHIISRFAFYLVIYLLMQQLYKNRFASLLAVILWAIPKPSLGFTIFYNEFVQAEIGTPLLLFSLYFFFRNTYIVSFILLGLAFHIHPPMAGFLTVCYVIALIWQKDIRRLLQCVGITGIIAFPIIYQTFLFEKNSPGYDAIWIALTKIRSPHHSFPLLWSVHAWFPFGAYVVVCLILFFILYKKISQLQNYIVILISMFAIIVSGFVFSEILPNAKIIAAVPFHITPLTSVLLSFPAIFFIFFLFNKSSFLYKICAIFFFFLFVSPNILVNSRAFTDTASNVTSAVTMKNVFRQDAYENDWKAAQMWANKHTTIHTMFIVPIYLEGFRVFSERAIVADWKDGSAGYLSPEFLRQWWNRMQDFGLDTKHYSDYDMKKNYWGMDEKKVQYLAGKYRASYFVTEVNKSHYNFQLVYNNKHFIIYKLYF